MRGYFHWTLVDNFEWAEGYNAKFGLYSLNVETRELLPKPSAELYRKYIAEHRTAVALGS